MKLPGKLCVPRLSAEEPLPLKHLLLRYSLLQKLLILHLDAPTSSYLLLPLLLLFPARFAQIFPKNSMTCTNFQPERGETFFVTEATSEIQ